MHTSEQFCLNKALRENVKEKLGLGEPKKVLRLDLYRRQ